MIREYYVYIMASHKNGTLYIGVTNDLLRRVHQHKKGLIVGFTKRYGIKQLVYYETTPNIQSAIEKEKQLKKWKRAWKIKLIEDSNPEWTDLYYQLGGQD